MGLSSAFAGLGCAAKAPAVERSETVGEEPSIRKGPSLAPLKEGLTDARVVDANEHWLTYEGRRRILFDGSSLADWKTGVYGDSDELEMLEEGAVIPIGVPISGMTYSGKVPRRPYQLRVEATRRNGSDFFLGLTFPVQQSHATLVLGGWGGTLCGLSCLDGVDASNNDTATYRKFPNGKRQTVVLVVTDERVVAIVNDDCIMDVSLVGRTLSIRPEVQPSVPLGVASFATSTLLHRVEVIEGP